MNNRSLVLLSLAIAAALVVFAFLTAARLPEGAVLPIHWSGSQPDDWAPALYALLLPPGLLLLITALFAVIPSLEPLQKQLAGSAPLLRAAWIGLIFITLLIAAVIGLPAWGMELPVNAIMAGTGLLLVMIGNALPKSRPGFFVGIRTPWAIADADNWIATHRLGGKLMMLAGLAVVVAAFLPLPLEALTALVVTAALGAAFVPFVYSWWYWHSRKQA